MAKSNNQPSSSDRVTGSVEDFLLSLADGINKAQRQLSQISIDTQAGQPAITYQLPRLDFEFRVTFEMSGPIGGEEGGDKQGGGLRIRPAGGEGGARGMASAQASSTIKGSFVAVPAQGGKPPAVMNVSLQQLSGGNRIQIQAFLSSAAGEKLDGIPVEFNVDRQLSKKLNAGTDLAVDTDVQDGRVVTNKEGIALTVLAADQEASGMRVAVLVDSMAETQTVVFKKA